MPKKLLASLLLVTVLIVGCTAQQAAQTASAVIQGILNIAQAEENSLPPQDAAVMTNWVNLGNTLEGQLNSCIQDAAGHVLSTTFAGCFNSFAGGLLNPGELAELRIMSGGSQTRVQVIATAIIVGVNGALTAYKAATQPTPVIAPTPATSAELLEIRREVFAQTGL
jgi:hypothetical protein